MSLFRGERVFPLSVHWQPMSNFLGTGMPDGIEWYDASQLTLYAKVNNTQVANYGLAGMNVSPVTATNPSATANLMSIALPANAMNVVGKTIRFHGSGYYNAAGTTSSTLTFNVQLAGTVVATFVSGAITNTAAGLPWTVDGWIVTNAIGASGSVVSDGSFQITLGTAAAGATTTYVNIPVGNTAVNVQANANVLFTTLSNVNNASYTVTQQIIAVEVGN